MEAATQDLARKGNIVPTVILITQIGFVCPVLIAFALLYLNEGPDRLIYSGSMLSVCIFAWYAVSWRIVAGTLFHPYFIFLLAAMLFNGGHLVLEVLNLNENGILNGLFSNETLMRTILLVNFGLFGFHLGALWSHVSHKRKVSVPARNPLSQRDIQAVGWVLLAISAVPAAMMIQDKLQVIMSSGYLGLFGREEATGFGNAVNLLASFLVPASYFLLAGHNRRKLPVIVAVIVILVYTAIIFFTGVRSTAGMSLVGFAYVYDRTVRRIPRIPLLLGGCMLIMVVFPLIAATREIAGAEKSTLTLLTTIDAVDNPAVQSLAEMGTSMNTVSFTLELVPGIRNYDFGLSYLYGLLTVVPNLYWDLHPSIERGSLADWLVWQVDSDWAEQGGGYGYSFIAEAYMNFGWFGVALLTALGFAFGKFTEWADQRLYPARIAILASYLSFFLLFARGEFTAVFRPLIWYALIPFFMAYGMRLLKRGHHSEEG